MKYTLGGKENYKKENMKKEVLKKEVLKNEVLKKYFGYDAFRPGQEKLIDAVLQGRDALGIMPTGAGKSICYQVPALIMPGITLVISPLISLMKDQVQALNQAGIHAAYINSSLTESQIAKALQFAEEGRYKIIYVAPERLGTNALLRLSERIDISILAVDEAHCISQWGQDFRPSYLNITEYIQRLPKRPVVCAFTATATETVKDDIVRTLRLNDPEVLVTGFDRKNLFFSVEKPVKKERYVLQYVEEHCDESGIIYCSTRKNVEVLCDLLLSEGVTATRYHAGLSADERKKNQEDFIYDIKPVMVATNAFGMGIDKSNVRYVIHFNMPESMENYYQEAGRAGRDGAEAECILLYSAQDVMINRFFIENKNIEDANAGIGSSDGRNEGIDRNLMTIEELKARDEKRLQLMVNYCLTQDCLREYILRYFGEEMDEPCGNCSNCIKDFEKLDCTEEAKEIIACVQEMRGRYGINVVAGTLAGANRAKLREYKVNALEAYGRLRNKEEAEIKRIIQTMILEDILTQTNDKYQLVKIGPRAEEVLLDEREVILKLPKKASDIVVNSPGSPDGNQNSSERYSDDSALRGSEYGATGKKRAKNDRKSDILNSRGMDLFERLRTLRMQIAKEEGVPPFVVFSDKTLMDMCLKTPKNAVDMLDVSGVGENKLERYGERFLQLIREFMQDDYSKLYFGSIDEAENAVNSKRKKR